jgi:hypothetical protein
MARLEISTLCVHTAPERYRRELRVVMSLPLYIKRATVAEQRNPNLVGDVHFNVEAPVLLFEPLADFCDAGKEQREGESDPTLVETLCA